MPFMKLNFATSEAFSEERLSQQLKSVELPAKVLGSLLAINCSFDHSNSRTAGSQGSESRRRSLKSSISFFIYCVHLFLLSVFCLSIILSIIFNWNHAWRQHKQSGLFWLILLTKIQGFTCYLFSFYCLFKKVISLRLKRALQSTSTGVGLMKNGTKIKTTNNVIFAYFVIRGILLTIYHEYLNNSQSSADNDTKLHQLFQNFERIHFIISVECERLANDFKKDSNSYQISVIRHYTKAHRKLIEILQVFRQTALSFWTSLQLIFGSAIIITSTYSLKSTIILNYNYAMIKLYLMRYTLLCPLIYIACMLNLPDRSILWDLSN
uniref:Gustatory receptor n=1 Tax=Ditylenchus dipsaci TaxID=166011 RepID=A0A915CQ66_9BILA